MLLATGAEVEFGPSGRLDSGVLVVVIVALRRRPLAFGTLTLGTLTFG
ncbi:MAG: hypothetical protein ACI9U2_005261, partial [Bradymonadia bacterium]